jgi:anthranilate/para-aminobenzoate synthase component II
MQESLANAGKNVTELMKNAQQGDKTAMNSTAKLIFQNIQDMVNAARYAPGMRDKRRLPLPDLVTQDGRLGE